MRQHVVSSDKRNLPPEMSIYHFFTDEIFIRRENLPIEIRPGEMVKIILADKTRFSDHPIFNTYLYSFQEYDSHCFKLTLENFEILQSED